ncbi:MAG: hypothetical protein ABW321_02760, partial [Polyangiales bacterium]
MNRPCLRSLSLPGLVVALWLSGCSDDDEKRSTDESHSDVEHSGSGGSSSDAGAPSESENTETSPETSETKDASTPSADAGNADGADRADGQGECGTGSFDSTYAAIQSVIFEKGGCANDMCHGAKASGGLDLRAGASYDSLIEVKSKNSAMFRVMPGVPTESFLFQKLRAATEPGSVQVEGSPMPSGAPPLSADHLHALRRWIEAGAPREGSVGSSITGRSDELANLLGSCLPDETPIAIKALEQPAADEGVQIAMAPFPLSANKEVDVCFAQYYDLSKVVPPEYQDAERGVMFVNGQRTRQDPHSHHLVVRHSGFGPESVNDPAFGDWTCRGGDSDGAGCDPLKLDGCGKGLCASELQHKAACIGFGPEADTADLLKGGVASAQTAQYYRAPREGVYETIPIRGILYMNSHAFNLTSKPTELHAWINLFYAKDRQNPIRTLAITKEISIAAGLAPFTQETYCADWVAPENSEVYTLGSHTHKRGRNFTVDMPDGTRIYTSANYADPVEKMFDPPLHFTSSDPKERTLKYCADFNNGIKEDGTPDLDLVTRLSTMPDRTTCSPVACTSGKVGAACAGASDNAACDVEAGDGSGTCDACTITAGQTTENEMFV